MLLDKNLFFTVDKVAVAIDRLRYFEPPEGYYLAFSGGKDSQTIYELAKEAGVKFDAHYNRTTLDPPELIYFIRDNYPDVIIDRPKKTMWQLIAKNGLPSRLKRWCCRELKEHGGEGRICVTGVRWKESNSRASNREAFELLGSKKENNILFSDNDEGRMMFENCTLKGKKIVNPIIDWLVEDVWEFIKGRGLKYCKLYDEGFTRIGCIGCPMADKKRIAEFERYPKYLANYKRALAKFLPAYLERAKVKGLTPQFTTPDEMMEWWIYGTKAISNEDQLIFDSFIEEEE